MDTALTESYNFCLTSALNNIYDEIRLNVIKSLYVKTAICAKTAICVTVSKLGNNRLEQYSHVKVVLWANTPSLYFWRACERKSLLSISLKLILRTQYANHYVLLSRSRSKCKITVLAETVRQKNLTLTL